MCKININQELNGIELSFESKPEAATLEEIKKQGFRWNRNKKIWYAKQTADRLTFAESLGQIEETTTPETDNGINLEGLGSNFCGHYGGAELSKAIREDLKRRGVKGCTVKCNHYSGITVTVKATAADFASLEEFKMRYQYTLFASDISIHGKYTGGSWLYSLDGLTDEEKEEQYNNYCRYEIEHRHDFNNYHRERSLYPQFTTAFCEKLEAVYLIANQWNYNNSDPYTDYHDVGYYLDIDIKAPEGMTARESMTEEEKTAYKAEQAAREAEEAARMARYEQERKEAEEAAKRYEEQRKQAETAVYNDIVVDDLEESEQLFVTGLIGGIGKECNISELLENSEEKTTGAVISRKVIFSDVSIFEQFGQFLLDDWMFLSGKGGTASEDVRLDNVNYYDLNEEQRETITFYYSDCVGVYVGDALRLVINPEGFNYACYTYIADNATITPAPEALEAMRKESEELPAFYIPAPVSEQIENIAPGDEITIYMSDGWILNNIEAGSGIVTDITPGNYAQYEGYYITLSYGKYFKGDKKVFIRDDKEILIYKGIKPRLPESVTTERINNNMVQVLTVFDGIWERVIKYYEGETPLVDTIQR